MGLDRCADAVRSRLWPRRRGGADEDDGGNRAMQRRFAMNKMKQGMAAIALVVSLGLIVPGSFGESALADIKDHSQSPVRRDGLRMRPRRQRLLRDRLRAGLDVRREDVAGHEQQHRASCSGCASTSRFVLRGLETPRARRTRRRPGRLLVRRAAGLLAGRRQAERLGDRALHGGRLLRVHGHRRRRDLGPRASSRASPTSRPTRTSTT